LDGGQAGGQGTVQFRPSSFYLSSWKCTKHLLHLLRQLRFNDVLNVRKLEEVAATRTEGRTAVATASDLARLNDHSELANTLSCSNWASLKNRETQDCCARFSTEQGSHKMAELLRRPAVASKKDELLVKRETIDNAGGRFEELRLSILLTVTF
uniref:Uncharacterized protein n=1 Tax=Macrostomum lignano TaxID=282301 RepID=A0A1I8FFV7_9PLAT